MVRLDVLELIKAYQLADEAVNMTDVETIVENEVTTYLEGVL